MDPASLNAEYGIPGSVSIIEGTNGLPKVVLMHKSGTRTEVYLHGAHIASWRNSEDEELFFLSGKSWFAPGKPIRGGIPVIFPQFGPGPLPPHGLARISPWHLTRAEVMPSGGVTAVLQLDSSPETLSLWPHAFSLRLAVTLTSRLSVTMAVINTGAAPFSFKAALHTYFNVKDIHRTTVLGLKGVTYVDCLRNDVREPETRGAITFEGETDRVYVKAPDEVHIADAASGRAFTITKGHLPDVVVWNPWIEKAKRMPDFGDSEYPRMLCVETGIVDQPVELGAGAAWQGWTRFSEKSSAGR